MHRVANMFDVIWRKRELRMRLTDRIHLYSRLSLYLRSGIPIRETLGLIYGSARKKGDIHILRQVEKAVLHGTSLEHALGSFPNAFPAFETHLIGIGEHSGSLPQNLAYLASLLVRRRTLVRKLRGALLYPCVIVLGTISVTSFLLLYTFPKIVPIFEGLNTPLPLSTRSLILISTLVTEHGLIVFLSFCTLSASIFWLTRLPQVPRYFERMTLRTPLLKELVRGYNLALISRTLSTLLASGITLVAALEHVGSGIRNKEYREALKDVGNRINEGRRLSVAFGVYTMLFPHTFVELIAAGESTGMLSSSLRTSAEAYEEELDESTRILATLIEPGLMIAMGLLVGFIAMAIITPIYSITQNATFR
ncbi:MAG TPA: type II secretion system F family protein [Candidatus Paceibacterota bacterium]